MTMYYLCMYMFLNYMLMFILVILLNLHKSNVFILSVLLMFYVLIICYKMNFFFFTYWYSYILFLVLVGGLMILFLYFVSMVSNLPPVKLNYFNMFIFGLFLMILMYDKNWMINLISIEGSLNIYEILYIFKNKMIFLNLMENFKMMFTLYMIFYLFLTMISSVLICLKVNLPLRQMMN